MLTFLKLGGSLITDKTQIEAANTSIIQQSADQIARAVQDSPNLRLIVGHGSGSFGHTAARHYETRNGVHSADDWRGFANVSVVAARLNHIVLEALHHAGVPVIRFQPSALLVAADTIIRKLEVEPIRRALDAGLVPLVYGDVAFDRARGGTIISTEELFVAIAKELRPQRILLAGLTAGVLTDEEGVIPQITPASVSAAAAALGGSHGTDVTGGMLSKVMIMLDLCKSIPNLTVRIFDGRPTQNIYRALTDHTFGDGTQISAD